MSLDLEYLYTENGKGELTFCGLDILYTNNTNRKKLSSKKFFKIFKDLHLEVSIHFHKDVVNEALENYTANNKEFLKRLGIDVFDVREKPLTKKEKKDVLELDLDAVGRVVFEMDQYWFYDNRKEYSPPLKFKDGYSLSQLIIDCDEIESDVFGNRKNRFYRPLTGSCLFHSIFGLNLTFLFNTKVQEDDTLFLLKRLIRRTKVLNTYDLSQAFSESTNTSRKRSTINQYLLDW